MEKVLTVILILMVILTVIYVSAVVYANTNDANAYSHRYVLYGAFEYESETPPTDWYTPEQLGIYGVTELGGPWLHIAIDREKEPFPLQSENPIFLYKDKFYEVLPVWVTPGLPEGVKQWQIPIGGALGACWVFTGVLFLKWRKNESKRRKVCYGLLQV